MAQPDIVKLKSKIEEVTRSIENQANIEEVPFPPDRNTCFGPTKVRLFSFVENALG